MFFACLSVNSHSLDPNNNIYHISPLNYYGGTIEINPDVTWYYSKKYNYLLPLNPIVFPHTYCVVIDRRYWYAKPAILRKGLVHFYLGVTITQTNDISTYTCSPRILSIRFAASVSRSKRPRWKIQGPFNVKITIHTGLLEYYEQFSWNASQCGMPHFNKHAFNPLSDVIKIVFS